MMQTYEKKYRTESLTAPFSFGCERGDNYIDKTACVVHN